MISALSVVLVLLLWWVISSVADWFAEDEEPGPAATSGPTAEAEGGRDDSDEHSESQDDDGAEDESGAEPEDGGANGEDSEEDLPEGACSSGDVEVTASTGEDSYAPDEAPLLIMEIEHTGNEGCELDVGVGQQEFSIVREGREVFTTSQCGSDDGGSEESHELEMQPEQVERAQLHWPRSDSSVDCSEPAELVPGDYELLVSLGGIVSEPHEFTLQEG